MPAACVGDRPEPESPPAVGRTEANSYFAMFMNDPTNKDSWHWLCRAAAGGHTAAQYSVGVRYRDGLPPVSRNLPRAYLWFTAAQYGGLTAAAIARDDVAKHLSEPAREKLRKRAKAVTEADCR